MSFQKSKINFTISVSLKENLCDKSGEVICIKSILNDFTPKLECFCKTKHMHDCHA